MIALTHVSGSNTYIWSWAPNFKLGRPVYANRLSMNNVTYDHYYNVGVTK